MKAKKAELSTEEKVDKVLMHLEHLDKRDKLRTWGSFFRGLISLIPVLVFLWGTWYFIQHGDEVMQKIAKTAAQQAAAVTTSGANGFMQQLQNFK